MFDSTLIGPWIRRFLLDHLVTERNLTRNTQVSYRDTMALLLPFVATKIGKPIDKLSIEDLSPNVVRLFLAHLEQERRCSIATRNQRLAPIHALARFIGDRSPEHVAWCTSIRAVPFKKAPKAALAYMEKSEMDTLLDTPDRGTVQGLRDYALLLFLYNTGARADETAHLTLADLNLGGASAVKILGKGGRTRFCPLWTLTVHVLRSITAGHAPQEAVFLNRLRRPITRFGIHALIKRCALKAAQNTPTLGAKAISPHTIRHTTAVHLLRAGVDLNTIRAWLGHVSLDTTNVYAEVDLEMKAKALAHCEIMTTVPKASWHQNQGLMAFLRGL
ncbi:MAG TPA: tyrosine-type recombinase/integrase [Terriglobia bacterium]|nr:tyrosine-type recombinase/integrase [Terriglobia bacterium]